MRNEIVSTPGLPDSPNRDVMTRGLLVFLCLFSLAGCALRGVKGEARDARLLGAIGGSVESATGTENTWVVFFANGENGSAEKIGVAELSRLMNSWGFVATGGRTYTLGAFKDANGNGTRDEGEPAAYLGTDEPIAIDAGNRLLGFTLELDSGTESVDRYPLDTTVSDEMQNAALRFSIEETTLEDPRFDVERSEEGMFTPLTALRENGAGIFLLEPYDPKRIPVIFVHGIGGTPRDLAVLVEKLDRTRFQPWVYSYPSGFRLRTVARGLSNHLPRLRSEMGFETAYIVAHSMGGLVTRAAIHEMAANGQDDFIGLYVTFASPLNGHSAVKWGLKYMPEPVPSWIDLEPGSEFIDEISKPLPQHFPYYLFFSFNRGGSVLFPDSSDSVVAVESQLPMWAQEDADRVWGYNADHMTILTNDEPVARFNEILDMTFKAANE